MGRARPLAARQPGPQGVGGDADQHHQCPLHRPPDRAGHVGHGAPHGVHRGPRARAQHRHRQLLRDDARRPDQPQPARRHRVGSGHGKHGADALPGRQHPDQGLRTVHDAGQLLRLGDRQLAILRAGARGSSLQPALADAARLLLPEGHRPDQARRPGGRHHHARHDGQEGHRRAHGDGAQGRARGRVPAAHRGVSGVRRHQGGYRHHHPAQARAAHRLGGQGWLDRRPRAQHSRGHQGVGQRVFPPAP